jgi:hypothetical protein
MTRNNSPSGLLVFRRLKRNVAVRRGLFGSWPPSPRIAILPNGSRPRNTTEGMTLATGLGMRPLVAHCHLALAKLYWRTDTHEQAEDHLITATTMYGDLGMTYWLERSEREVPRVE